MTTETFQIRLDLSSTQESREERACFCLRIGDEWTQALTPTELEAVCKAAATKRETELDRKTADILAALETSALFNFKSKSGTKGRAGTPVVATKPSDSETFSKPGVKTLGT